MINLASFDGTEYGLNWKRTILRDDNEQHMKFNVIMRRIYYVRKNEREREARKEYRMSKLQKDTINQLYMIDIMREGMENDDVRLFRGLS